MHNPRTTKLCFIVVVIASAAFAQPIEYENEIVILSPNYEPQLKAYLDEFEKFAESDLGKNISVKYVYMDTDNAFNRIFSNQSREDVIWGGGVAPFIEAKDRGYLIQYPSKHAPYLTTSIPGLSLMDPDGFWYASAISGFGFMINTRLLNELGIKKPTDWDDLLDEKYYGLIAFTKPANSGSMHTLAEVIFQMNGQTELEINMVGPGSRYFTDMKQNVGIMTNSSADSFKLVAEGDYAIAPGIDYATYDYRRMGYPVKFVYPNMTYFSPDSVAILKSAKNKNLAKYFVDFVLSKRGQELTISKFYRIPVRSDIDIPKFLVKPDEINSIQFPLDIELSKNRYSEFVRFFDEEIVKHYKENLPVIKIKAVVDPQLAGLWESGTNNTLKSGFGQFLASESRPYVLNIEVTVKSIGNYSELGDYDLYAPFSTYSLNELMKQNPEIIRNNDYAGVPVQKDFSGMIYAKTPMFMIGRGKTQQVLLAEDEKLAILYQYMLNEKEPINYEILNLNAEVGEKIQMLDSGRIDAFYATENEYLPYKEHGTIVKNRSMMLYIPLVMLHSPDVLLKEDENVIEHNKRIQPYFDRVWYINQKKKAIELLDQWLKSGAKDTLMQNGFRPVDYQWNGSGQYARLEEFPADWSKMNKALESYKASSKSGVNYSDMLILVAILLFFLLVGIISQKKKKNITDEKRVELSQMENKRQELLDMMRITKIKYHKRELDEESFREIIRNYEEKLIEIEEKIKRWGS